MLPGASGLNAGSVSPPPLPKPITASSSSQSIPSTPVPSSIHAGSSQTPAVTLKRSADNIFAPCSSKKAKGSEVLGGLLTEVVGMNQVFQEFLAPPPPPSVPSDLSLMVTSACCAKAISLLEKEDNLDTDDAMAFIHVLVRDKAIVDTYNSFSNPTMCRAFIDSVLARFKYFVISLNIPWVQ